MRTDWSKAWPRSSVLGVGEVSDGHRYNMAAVRGEVDLKLNGGKTSDTTY